MITALLLVFATTLIAQSPPAAAAPSRNGQPEKAVLIIGLVLDQSAAPIPEALVTLRDRGGSTPIAATRTDQNGNFTFSSVPLDHYDLQLESPGFQRLVVFVDARKDPSVGTLVLKVTPTDGVPTIVYAAPAPLLTFPAPQTLDGRDDSAARSARSPSSPDQPSEPSLCDIVQAPELFAGKMVSIRARVLISFEDFEVSAAACHPKKIDSVWLEYGSGPKHQPTIWCCGDLTPRDPMRLVQSSEFRKFHRYLTAQAKERGCYGGECPLYRVTATLTGRFDAVPTETCPDGRSQCPKEGGFGHFGLSSARLVIRSVSNVVAEPVDPSVYQNRK
jgi:hypothetical protein